MQETYIWVVFVESAQGVELSDPTILMLTQRVPKRMLRATVFAELQTEGTKRLTDLGRLSSTVVPCFLMRKRSINAILPFVQIFESEHVTTQFTSMGNLQTGSRTCCV